MTEPSERISPEQIASFFYFEADLLDRWDLKTWLELFEEDAMYIVPATDLPHPEVHRDMTLISDSLPRLRSRVSQLLGGRAWAETPHSRTRRLVTNIVVSDHSDGALVATANFMVHRFRHERCDTFIGRYLHDLAFSDGRLRFRNRRAILDHEALTPHAMVSFIL